MYNNIGTTGEWSFPYTMKPIFFKRQRKNLGNETTMDWLIAEVHNDVEKQVTVGRYTSESYLLFSAKAFRRSLPEMQMRRLSIQRLLHKEIL